MEHGAVQQQVILNQFNFGHEGLCQVPICQLERETAHPHAKHTEVERIEVKYTVMKCTESAQPSSEMEMKQMHEHGMQEDAECLMQHQEESVKALEHETIKSMCSIEAIQ